jgi:hypothetical protein
MATTKAFTAIWNGQSLTAGAGDTTSTAVTLDDGYGAALHVQLTNGGTGPTVPAQVQIEVSGDNSEWYDFGGPLIGTVTASDVVSWGGIDIPIGVEFLRLVAGSNTGQAVTVDADISEVTAIDV